MDGLRTLLLIGAAGITGLIVLMVALVRASARTVSPDASVDTGYGGIRSRIWADLSAAMAAVDSLDRNTGALRDVPLISERVRLAAHAIARLLNEAYNLSAHSAGDPWAQDRLDVEARVREVSDWLVAQAERVRTAPDDIDVGAELDLATKELERLADRLRLAVRGTTI